MDGIRALYRSVDGIIQSTTLLERFSRHFHVATLCDLTLTLNLASANRASFVKAINELVLIIAEEARGGDFVSKQVFENAAEDLAESTIATIRKGKLGDASFPVGLVGGAWNASELIIGPYTAKVQLAIPSARITRENKPPALAAALMARELFA